jgi:hypothetical protein
MVFNATFNNISAISGSGVLLVGETEVPGENHRPATNHWQTWSYNVVHFSLAGFEFTSLVVINSTDCIGRYKANYHMTTTTTKARNQST